MADVLPPSARGCWCPVAWRSFVLRYRLAVAAGARLPGCA